MNTTRVCRKLALVAIAVICCLSFSGCEGDYTVPITSGPTRKIDQQLLGIWVSKDGTDKIKVRRLDDSIYIVSYNDRLQRTGISLPIIDNLRLRALVARPLKRGVRLLTRKWKCR